MDGLTFGLELEWADVDKRIELPPVATWDWQDWTIVNSDGHANDPTGKTWVYGGEINTVPTATIDEQVAAVATLRDLLKPTVNYSCALHVHIAYAPLKDDIALLHKFFNYTQREQAYFYATAFRYHAPFAAAYATVSEFNAAKRYMTSRLRRTIGTPPPNRVKEIRAAETPQQFYDAHASLSERTGNRVWHLSKRAGVNMKSLWKHGTVEFRCFAGTTDPDEVRAALTYSRQFFINALTGGTLQNYEVPQPLPVLPLYDHALATRYEQTKFQGKTDGRSHIGE